MARRSLGVSLSVVALALGLAAPRAAQAQNSYVQQMQGYMQPYTNSAMGSGYQVVTQMVTGSLNQGANGTHSVTLTGGRNYMIQGVCDRDCTDVDLRLMDANGNSIASDAAMDDHPTLRFTAPYSGNFTLRVDMATCSTNPCFYGVQLFGGSTGGMAMQPTPQPMAAPMPQPMSMGPTQMGQIAVNQQVTGNLQPNDGRVDNKPTQVWNFACQAGQAIQMDILSTWDNYGFILDPMGNRVAQDDDSGESLNSRIQYTCNMTGVYRLGITTYQPSTSTGTYTLQVQLTGQTQLNQPAPMGAPVPMAAPMPTPMPMAAPMPQSAPGATMPQPANLGNLPITGGIPAPGTVGQITMGTNVQGRLETGDQRMNDGTYADIWQFQGVSGQHITIELRSEEFDTYVQLLDAAGNRLAEDDDSLGDFDSKVEITLPASGMFQIVVNNFGEDRRAGIYTLTLR